MVVPLDKAVIARLRKFGENFEIYVDFYKALEIKNGKDVDPDELLASFEVYKDARKGERHSEETLKKVFKTTDVYQIAKIIIKEGELQIPAEYRRKLKEELKKQIIELIRKNYIDPKTKIPHPPQRIELAMEKAKVNIDITKPAEAQLNEIVKKLRPIIPLKSERVLLAIKIPAEYIYKTYNYLGVYQVENDLLKKYTPINGSSGYNSWNGSRGLIFDLNNKTYISFFSNNKIITEEVKSTTVE